MSHFQLYSGKRDATEIQRQHGIGYRVIYEMSRDLVGLNRCLFFDRYFTSVPLLESLEGDNIYACGTLMTNRRGSPPALHITKRALRRDLPNRGDSVSYQKNGVTVTAWNDNNVVVIAHTQLQKSAEAVLCKRQIGSEKKDIPQPKAIERYNQHMNGVDTHDQMRKKYPAGRASKKYWKYIFWFTVDCCTVNSWILYKESHPDIGRRYTHKDFILDIVKGLIGDFTGRKMYSTGESIAILQTHTMAHSRIHLPVTKKRCKGCSKQKLRLETVYG